MRYYELTCLVPVLVFEEEKSGISQKIKDIIQEESGSLEDIAISPKDSLFYSKAREKAVTTITVSFHLAAEKIENLLKKIKMDQRIVRCALLNKEKSKKILAKNSLKGANRSSHHNYGPEQEVKGKKVELKEIDKKIEEILKE